MLKACTQGMRKANTPQASKVLKTAVEKLRSLMEKHANKVKERKYFKDVKKLMMSEIDVAVTKIKEKYKNRETKKGHDGARLVKGMRVHTKFGWIVGQTVDAPGLTYSCLRKWLKHFRCG